MLKEGIIEPSNSPWRAQVVVTKEGNHKKRLVVDYSQTINKFTQLDAYPLPNINTLINEIAQHNVFSTIDMKSAYHQVPINEGDKPYTAFEADHGLYQLKRIPFGVTNGVATFQRIMDGIITGENLSSTFAYLDNVFICGKTQAEHDQNLGKFLEIANSRNLTYNDEKCVFSTKSLNALGCLISEGSIKPDPERLRPLQELPIPPDNKALKRVIGLFSYYSKWIPNFSHKIAPLVRTTSFPLNKEVIDAFNLLKHDIENSVVCAIDHSAPFELETDASDIAIAGVLNQNGHPVAYHSRMLQGSKLKHPSIEKEASVIIE